MDKGFPNFISLYFRKPFTNVNRWFTTVVNQPNVKSVLGSVTLAAKMAEFDAKKFAEFSGKGDGGKKKEKGEKKKEEPKKKEEKPKPKKETTPPDDDMPGKQVLGSYFL